MFASSSSSCVPASRRVRRFFRPARARTRKTTKRNACLGRRRFCDKAASSSSSSFSTAEEEEIVGGEGKTESSQVFVVVDEIPESVRVQRRLARQMAEAQMRWIASEESTVTKNKKRKKDNEQRDVESGGKSNKRTATGGRKDSEEEDLLYELSLVDATAFEEAFARGKWLLFLLVLQSCSSFVLSSNEKMIQENVIITLYLTMLVGAGGNAGNQSAIEVITGLAMGAIEYSVESFAQTASRQLRIGTFLGVFLGFGSFMRVFVTNKDLVGSFAISAACFSIVLCSTLVGGALPYLLIFCGQEPANAGSSVQVCMDVLGVAITCLVCTYIFQHADIIHGVFN